MITRKCILFVDDEPNILEGLRRLLTSSMGNYELCFAASGRSALEILEQKTVDILISDMRMPEMNGVELLSQVRERYPGIVRVALSGQSETEINLKASVLAHQFLAKPCPREKLVQVIQQACALSDMIGNSQLLKILTRMKTIPSLPSLYLRLTGLVEDPHSSLQDIGSVIASDLGMSAKVMQLVNSAYFGLSDHVSDPTRAVALLGINTLRSLILNVHIFDQFHSIGLPGAFQNRLWAHSLGTAMGSRLIMKRLTTDKNLLDYAYIAGLLHDVGILILAHNLPVKYQQVLKLATQNRSEIYQVERQIFQATHMEIGAYLLGIWGFPIPVIHTIRFHHIPGMCTEPDSRLLLGAVHLADYFELRARGTLGLTLSTQLDHESLVDINLDKEIEDLYQDFESILIQVDHE